MPTDTARGRIHAVKFALRGVAWSLGLFGLLRLTWTEAHVLLPFTRVQGELAAGLFGTPTLPVARRNAAFGVGFSARHFFTSATTRSIVSARWSVVNISTGITLQSRLKSPVLVSR